MPQKKKKNVKKTVSKNSKPKPPTKDSINVKIGLQDMLKLTCASCAAEEKKKKPRRRKRQPAQTTTDNNNNVSYVDDYGRPISNEIINKSFNRSYIPQPFSRNSSVVGTSFNESSIIDKVTEKIKNLNTSNQSMNNTVLNQSTAAPAPPQIPRPPPSTIVPASPSVAPQSLNFNLSSPVRQVGLTPMQASSMALNTVQQYALSSMRAALNYQEALARIFKGVSKEDETEIIQKIKLIKGDAETVAKINEGKNGGAQSMKFKKAFKLIYTGSMIAKEAASIAWQAYQFVD